MQRLDRATTRSVIELRRWLLMLAFAAALGGCASMRRPAPTGLAGLPWNERVAQLGAAASWQLQGRTAVALGQQGWQANLDWRQTGAESDLRLSGPLNIGALTIKATPQGLSLNGAPPNTEVVGQLEARLGFELPLAQLRYWLLGIPDPTLPFELSRNPQDRAQHLSQAGWDIAYDQYLANGGDTLPARLVLTRANARVRVVVDHWQRAP